jgi:hypothetical protein
MSYKLLSSRSLGRLALVALTALLSLSLTTCDLFKVGLGSKVDINPPEISITSPSTGTYAKGDITVTGTVSDDLGLAGVTVLAGGSSYAATVAGGSWSVTLPALKKPGNSSGLPEGRTTITAMAQDQAGKTRTADTTVYLDNTGPFVLLTVPQGYGSSASTYTGYIDFKGETWDPSPVTDVSVYVLDQATKAVVGHKAAEGSASWSVRFTIGLGMDLPFTAAQSGKTYLYYVEATDAAGNKNGYAFHSQDIYALMTTKSIQRFPVTSELGAMDQDKRDTILADLNGLGYAELHAKRINTSPYDPPVADFKYDSDGTKPVISFTNIDPGNPVEANVVGSKTPLLGSVSPGPAGTAVDGNSIQATLEPLSPAGSSIALTPTINPIGSTVNFQFALKQGATYLPNGRYRITANAQAAGGSPAIPVSVEFLIDNNVPQFVRLTPLDNAYASRIDLGGGKGQGVRLNVIVNDDNDTTDGIAHSSLTQAVASATDGGAALPGVTITDGGDVVESTVRIGRLWMVDVPYAAGTDLYLDYTARDTGGSVATRSHHVTIDESAPAVSVSDPTAEALPVGALLSADSYIFRGSATDSQSGIEEVRWWLGARDGSDLPADPATWHAATGLGAWSALQDFTSVAEGQKRLFVKAKDSAGNWSTTAAVDLTYDKASPVATMTADPTAKGYAEGGVEYREGAFALRGDCDDDAGTAGRRATTVTLTVSKDGGAATGLSLSSGGAASGAWTYSQAVNAATHADDGLYLYTLTVTDEAGRTSVATTSVRIDTTPPTISITAPAAGEALDVAGYTLRGSAYDLGSGFDATSLKYVLDGVEKAPTLVGQGWTAAETLSGEGSFTLKAKGQDRLGNSFETAEITFYYDMAKPDLAETTVGEDTKLTNAAFSLGGTAHDSNALKDIVVSATKGGTLVHSWAAIALSGQDQAWSQAVSLSDLSGDGTYVLTVTVSDIANRTTSLQRTVKIDTTKPTIGTMNLAEGQLLEASSYTVIGTAGDSGSGVASVEYSLDGGATWSPATGGSNWAAALSGLSDGLAKAFRVRAVDGAGNVGDEVAKGYKVDLAPPSLSVAGLAEGVTEYRNADVALSGTSADANGLSAFTVKYSKNGGPSVTLSSALPGAGDTWAASLPAATGDGSYAITIASTDMVGKTTTVQRAVVIDTTPPTLTVASPAASELVAASTIGLSGTVEDNPGGKGVASLEYSLDSTDGSDGTWTSVGLAGYSWTAAGVAIGAAEGSKSLWVRASDGLNAPATKHVSFIYDAGPPVLTETTSLLDESQAIKKAAVVFGGTVSDSNALARLELSVNGGAATTLTTSPGAWTYTLPAAVDGDYNLVFTAIDAAGRTTTQRRHVLMDATKPAKPVFTSSAGAYAESSLVVSGTSGDATSGLAAAWYRIDSGAAAALVGTDSWFQSLNTSALAEGSHSVTVWTEDRAGNLSDETSQSFTVDRANPTLSVEAAYDGVVYRNGSFTVDITVTDSYQLPASPLALTLKVDGVATPLGSLTCVSGAGTAVQVWRQAVTASGDGTYVLSIGAADSVGRLAQPAERTVTIDSTAPTVSVTSVTPILDGNLVNGKVTLSATASDASGLAGVKYFARTVAGVPSWSDGDGTSLTAPYSVTINTTSYSDGNLYLYVLARDRAGNDAFHSATVTVQQASDNPVVAVSSPASGDAMGADRKVRGTFMDDDGVASGGAILYVKKAAAGSYDSFPISTSGAASQLVAWTVDLSSFLATNGDGSYDLYIRVTDDATRKSGLAATYTETAVQQFSFDNSPPTVSAAVAKTPLKDAYAAGDAVVLSWTAQDASGLASQTFDLDGSGAGLGALQNPSGNDYNVTYTVPAGATSGSKTFTLIVTDNTGRSTTRYAIVTVDTDKPTVEANLSLEPAFVGYTPNGAFSLKGTAADNRGLSKVQVKLTGDGGSSLGWTDASLSNGNWSFAIADSSVYVPASGSLGIEVKAIDAAGNESVVQSFSQVVNQAADKPTIDLISPVGGTTYGTTVQISGTASDDDGLADLDNNGVIDANAITIEYWKTAEPGTIYTVAPTITGSGRSATWNYSLSGLEGADYSVHVRAKDDNGVVGDWTADTTFRVNSGVPNLVVNTSFPTYGNNATLAITGTIEDSDGIKYVHARVNGGSWILATAAGATDGNSDGVWDSLMNGPVSWTINLNLGSDGLKTIEIQGADGSDSIAALQRSTTLDTTAPVGAFDSQFRDDPTGSFLDTSLLNKVVRITGSVTELNLRDSNPIEISIEDGIHNAWTPVTGTFIWSHQWDTTALADASYVIKLRIYDKAGNITDTIAKTVTTKQSADVPVITQGFVPAATAADAGNNVLGAFLKVSGTISDDDGFASGAVSIYLDGSTSPIGATSTTGNTGTWEYTWAVLGQGQHYLLIRATDRNGATFDLGPTYFLVDNANPVLSLSTPAAGAKVKAGTLTIAGTASDGGGFGATPLSITLRHSNPASSLDGQVFAPALSGGTFSQDLTVDGLVLDGTLYMDLTLTDRSGKQTSITRAVTIDTTSPTLALNSPSSAAYINGLVSVTGTADDLNGLADVTFQVLNPTTKLPVANVTRSSSTLAAWEFPFNAGTYASTTYGIDVHGDGKLWKVYFRLAAADNSGNVEEYKPDGDWPYFYIDTDGDKPTISVTQPKNGEKIGGIVNMYGTATDDDGPVMQVEVQIDFNGDGDFADSRDLNNNDGDSNPATGIELGTDTDILGRTVRIGDSAHKWEDESAWYVVPVVNNAWTLELNSDGELYPSNTAGTGDIVIHTRSRDKFGLASEISTETITLDQTFPRIEGVTPLDQTYQHGTFDLVAAFGDNIDLNLASVSQIRINVNKTGYQTLTEGGVGAGHNYALTAHLAEPQNGYDLSYPINTNAYFSNSSGILYVDLYVRDESGYVNQKSLSFYVDNQVPTSSWSDSTTRPDGSGLRNGMITVNAVPKTYVEGNYGDSGSVSGISHAELYFVKAGKVLRIKTASGQWGGTPATESIPTENYSLATNTWSAGSDPAAPIVANAALGDDYVIKVDKPTEMSDLSLGTDVDGDGYHEYLGIYEGKARFRAYFDSQNLPDGLADLHYVVYDLAGNYVHRMRQVFIANNGPVVNRIQVGSDLNNDGSVANQAGVDEIKDYYYPAGSVDRSDYQKIRNLKLYLAIDGDDPNGSNKGVKQVFVDVYDASGSTLLGNAYTSGLNPSGGDATTTLVPTPGAGSWSTPYSGGKADYSLKVSVRDADDINTSRWVKVSVYNPADSTPPTVTLYSLAQVDQDKTAGHLELQGDNSAAVWNTIKAAYGNDDDPKASGSLVLKGRVYDESRLTEVSVVSENNPTPTLASWSGGHLVSNTAAFTIDSEVLDETGHTVTFTYKWDTSKVTGVAGLNKTVAFGAKDGTPNSATPASQKVDVVPYIKAMARDSANYNTSRSRLGRYVLRQGETVTVTGFNLFNSTSDSIAFPGSTVSLPGGSTATGFTVTLAATATSGNVVATVNSQPTINNLNDNAKAWNSEYDLANPASTLWNDDRNVQVWRSDDNQAGANRGYFTGSVDPEYPAMSIDGAGVLYGSWSNYATSDVYYGTNGGTLATIFHSYDPLEHTDIHYGTRVNVAINANTYGNGAWDVTGAGGSYVWNSQATNANSYSGTAYNGVYNAEALYHDQKLMQFINQRVVTSGDSIHMSYYDTDTKSLKYWYHLSNVNGAYAQTWINVDGGADGDDGTATAATKAATLTSQNYSSGVAASIINSTNGGTIKSNYFVVGDHVTAGQTVVRVGGVGGTYYNATADGVVTSLAANNGTAVVGTELYRIQYDTTVSSIARNVGDPVGVGTTLMTMANGTVVTANSAGYVAILPVAVGGTVQHGITAIATISSQKVATLQKKNGDYVTSGTVIMTMADASTVTAPATGVLTDVLPEGTVLSVASTTVARIISGTRLVTAGRSSSAGEYSAIDVMPTSNFPVIAYYDITNQTVKLARASAVNPTAAQWAIQTVMAAGDPNFKYSGKYISMKIDSSGYVHLAFFRNSTGDLIYMKSTNHPTDGSAYTFGSSVIIDSIGSVGTWADISIDGGYPVISYLDSSMVNTFDGVKMAYYDPALESVAGDTAGEPDSIDGWETMNAALGYEVESVRTSVEADTGANFWQDAIGYGSSDYFRIAYYVK